MKRYIISLLIFFVLLTCLLPSNIVFADASATISVGSSNITVGDKINITISFTSSSDPIATVDSSLSYDDSVLKYTGSNGGAGYISIKETASNSSSLSLTVTLSFEAIKSSTNTVLSLNGGVFRDDGFLIGPVSASRSFEVKGTVVLSSNANLKDIRIPSGTLTPSFSASVTSYTVTVENNISDFPLQVTAADSKSTIALSEPSTLQVGKNVRTITVTAENGTKKVYTITVTRKAASPTPTKTPSSTPARTPDTQPSTQTPYPTNTESPSEMPASQPTQDIQTAEPSDIVSIPPTTDNSGNDEWDKFINTVIWVVVLGAIIIVSVIFLSVYLIKRKESMKKHGTNTRNRQRQNKNQQNRRK